MKFRGVCLITDNAPRLVEFYRIFLREEPLVEGSHYGFGAISIYDPGNVNVAKEKNVWLTFCDADIDALYKRLLRDIPDMVVTTSPEKKPWGAYSFWVLDPDGNMISVFQDREGKYTEARDSASPGKTDG